MLQKSIVVVAVILAAATSQAQETATLTGIVSDPQGGVLPGVSVTAVETSTGFSQTSVSNPEGRYRFPVLAAGVYRIQADLTSFASAVIPQLELLVGQNARVDMEMSVARFEETITVTGESPLVDVLSAEIAGNVDRRMMDELPIQGRNWMELSLFVKGVTANVAFNRPGIGRDEHFQLNLDGQQITQQVGGSGFGQPKFSREAIAEFQITTNLFDITQGRSAGAQVNAITRAGSNELSGSFYGYFRDDALNAKDHVAGEVLPFKNQQIGGAVGGRIVRDKLHWFLSYEYENEPATVFAEPPQLPGQSFLYETPTTQNSFTARLDHSATDRDRLSYRVSFWDFDKPVELFSSSHPSAASERTQESLNILGTWTRVWNPELVTELKAGYNGFEWQNLPAFPEIGVCNQELGQPTDQTTCQAGYVFPGLVIGAPRNFPSRFTQDLFSARFQLNWHRGRHDFKIGGEYLGEQDGGEWRLLERGEFVFDARPPDLNRRFPEECALDPSCWDVSGLDPLVNRFNQNVGNWVIDIPRPTWALWFGDNWRATNNLMINYGVRWDVDWGALAPPHVTTQVTFNQPSSGRQAGDPLFKHDIRDLDNVAPRVGFAYNVKGEGDLVIRGGSGLFHTVSVSNVTFSQQSFNGERILVNSYPNDGLPGFLDDPTRGVTPDDVLNGRVPLPPQAPRAIAHNYEMPYTWQTSIGFQKELGADTAVEADMVHWQEYNSPRMVDPNQLFDPETGYSLNTRTVGRPDPKFTTISYMESEGSLDYLALQTGFRRRFRNNFQYGVTYTLMFYKHDNTPGWFYAPNNTFDPDDDWARSFDFQRNTLRVNGIYNLPHGFSISGAYFYGSGNYWPTTVAGQPFGKSASENRLNIAVPIPVRAEALDRFDGPNVIGVGPGNEIPRNALRGYPLHKVDIRLTKAFDVGNVRIVGLAEVYNLFNHANFGLYNGQVNSKTFGDPRQNRANAFVPRSVQLAFRVEF